jgi:DNA-binding GntR family transcriptional regulator
LLTEQVADDIRTDVVKGTITGRLPTEVELATQYGVSRVTIRRAMAILVSEDLIEVIHGRGTFVAER